MKIRDALGEGAKVLRKIGAWGAGATDAEILLAHALGAAKEELYAHNERPVPAAALRRYRGLLARRAKREPVAYLVGTKEFFGLPFFVDKRVLIPRPETEILVERALKILRQEPRVRSREKNVIDVGTGSGAIAVAVARSMPDVRVIATDASAPALAVARKNAAALGVASRIRFVKADLLPSSLLAPGPWLILANLPYVATGEWRTLAPDIRRYEPRLALDGGRDGLVPYRRFLDAMKERGLAAFTLLAEIHPEQAATLRDEIRTRWPAATVTVHKDLTGKKRVIEATVG